MIAASVTGSNGGESTMTVMPAAVRLSMISTNRGDPSRSLGFGGTGPDVMT
jgi:hypothetical protein